MIVDPVPARSRLITELEHKRARATSADLTDLVLLRRALPRLPTHLDPRALSLVVGHCGTAYASQDAGLLTACLWAARHRGAEPEPSSWNMGHSLRAIPGEHAQRVWRDLCAANDLVLARRMATTINTLTLYGVPTDWHRLHRDLRSWHQGFHHVVLRRWCTGLFGDSRQRPYPAQPAAEPDGSSADEQAHPTGNDVREESP